MSTPRNLIDDYSSYRIHAIMAAFKDTEAAEETVLPLSDSLDRGDRIGSGVVIFNDAKPSATKMSQLRHTFEWNSLRVAHTLTMGDLMLTDRNAASLLTFLRDKVVFPLETSLENLTFSLRIFWVLDTQNDVERDLISSTHFYFSVPEIKHSSDGSYNYYRLPMIALQDTKCQLPNYSNLYNFTVTHQSGNLHEKVPEPIGAGARIVPRGEEDAFKDEIRQSRIDLSTPMITLLDAMEALQADLNATNKVHLSQLQIWQSYIRDDFIDKLPRDLDQKKEIPIDYSVYLDPVYHEYKIDNRNLPFEQPEQNQPRPGIRAIPSKAGEPLSDMIDRIMRLSKKIGDDVENGLRYKVVTTWRRMPNNRIKYDIQIHQFVLPETTPGVKDTGPGASAIRPLMFEYKTTKNNEIYELSGRTSRNDRLTILETDVETEEGRVSYGGDRESVSAERDIEKSFFESGFSGPRAFIRENRTTGVEYPRALANAMKSRFANQFKEDAKITITINGNPELYSDLLRKPSDVVDRDAGGATLYKFVEKEPMYAKLIIRNTDSSSDEETEESVTEKEEDLTDIFHHRETHMHVYRIDTHISAGAFTQKLHLLRTDDLV